MYKLSDYNYHLPESLIAQEPAMPADHSKLLVPEGEGFSDYHFYELPGLLTTKDVLFFNDSKVIKARVPLHHVFVEIPHHTSASRMVEEGELFFLELKDAQRFEGLVTLTKRVRKGAVIHYNDDISFLVEELTDKGVIFRIDGMSNVITFFETYGQLPLPPYIEHSTEKEKHYQTVFADNNKLGSVAAPTASLHFTETLLHALHAAGISTNYLTLHVGLGTFKPVDTDDIRDYKIHEETIIINESIFEHLHNLKTIAEGHNIIAVGTTVARTLETLPYLYKLISVGPRSIESSYWDACSRGISTQDAEKYIVSWERDGSNIICKTRIFIYPGFKRKVVDGLITNFHLPGSTLLMLVASFIGYEHMMRLYEYAIKHHYRFFSFGDGMFLRRVSEK